ncbi:MAG: YqgE/AlgH family protein [Hyphomicrobiales bacterium]|jgi:putative transcriptional regulator
MDEFPSLAGQVLIAMPSIGDPRFERTVIYLCVHDEHGAMGIVVNRPDAAQTVGNVLGELGLIERETGTSDAGAQVDQKLQSRLDSRVLLGGPVETTRGFVLHSPDVVERDGTVAVTDDVHLSTKIDVLRDIGLGKGPDQFLLALGLANWGEGQLDQEILQNAWLHAPMGAKALFETPPELHYAASLSNLGVDVTKLSPVAGRG